MTFVSFLKTHNLSVRARMAPKWRCKDPRYGNNNIIYFYELCIMMALTDTVPNVVSGVEVVEANILYVGGYATHFSCMMMTTPKKKTSYRTLLCIYVDSVYVCVVCVRVCVYIIHILYLNEKVKIGV